MRAKIYYNLNESEFFVDDDNIRYYFSSMFNKERFKKKVDEILVSQCSIFSQKYRIKSTSTIEFMIKLKIYKGIEKRGFYVTKNRKPLKIMYSIDELW